MTGIHIQQSPNTFQSLDITTPGPAPEPGTLWLGGIALAIVPVLRRYRRG